MKAHDDESGDWRGLNDSGQFPRYAAIAKMVAEFNPRAKVLDVGCGEAHLHRWLPSSVDYSGLEPSLKAVALAQSGNDKLRIIHGSGEAFTPADSRYDCVIFNEMLYYSKDPLGLLLKFAQCLEPGGAILGSIFQKPEDKSFKHRIKKWLKLQTLSNVECDQRVRRFLTGEQWPVLKESRVELPGTGLFWNIWLVAPPASSY